MLGMQRALTRIEPPRFASVEVMPETVGAARTVLGSDVSVAPAPSAG